MRVVGRGVENAEIKIEKMTVADQIADFLANQGCTHAFGFVGGANLTLFQAIGKRMEMICCHHEQAAAMAADAHYRVSGNIAPVLLTAGAGVMNSLTGVMSAHVNGIPLFVLSGNEKSMYLKPPHKRCMGFQGFNPSRIVSTFVKAVESADNATGAIFAAEGLYRLALAPRQGPVWCDIAQDIAAARLA